jgi:hypothetical protein
MSKSTNPDFFFPPWAGLAVSTIAHMIVRSFLAFSFSTLLFANLAIAACMSNHSADHPGGILSPSTLKSFFSVSDNANGTLKYTPGHERIPNSWYRRPLGPLNEWNFQDAGLDLVKMASQVPSVLAVGGNAGKINSFVGVDLGDITGGAYHTSDMMDPKKFTCFIFQWIMTVTPGILQSRGLLPSVLSNALGLLTSQLVPLMDPSCPKICELNPFIYLS